MILYGQEALFKNCILTVYKGTRLLGHCHTVIKVSIPGIGSIEVLNLVGLLSKDLTYYNSFFRYRVVKGYILYLSIFFSKYLPPIIFPPGNTDIFLSK